MSGQDVHKEGMEIWVSCPAWEPGKLDLGQQEWGVTASFLEDTPVLPERGAVSLVINLLPQRPWANI